MCDVPGIGNFILRLNFKNVYIASSFVIWSADIQGCASLLMSTLFHWEGYQPIRKTPILGGPENVYIKLDQTSWKNGQQQTPETHPQLQTSRKKRSWKPQETMAMRRCRNRSNDLIHGGRRRRWWWWWWWWWNVYIINCFRVHPVCNMGSHITYRVYLVRTDFTFYLCTLAWWWSKADRNMLPQ